MHLGDKDEIISFHFKANCKSLQLTVKVRAATVPEAMRRQVEIDSFILAVVMS